MPQATRFELFQSHTRRAGLISVHLPCVADATPQLGLELLRAATEQLDPAWIVNPAS